MKKGLLATIITGVAVALSLCVYTIVVVVNNNRPAGYTPAVYDFNIAYRTGDIVKELDGLTPESEELSLEFAEGVTAETQPIVYNDETDQFEVVKAGEVKAVVSAENGDTTTYNITTYLQGNGKSESSPYVICNADHMREYAALANDKNAEDDYLAYHIALVSDVDLAGSDWMPIGDNYRPFTGTINGTGHTISNMKINVNADNYTNFIAVNNPQLSISLGFFGKTVGASINDVNFKDADILVSKDVLAKINDKDYSSVTGLAEGEINKVSVGTVAGIMTRTTYTSTKEGVNVKVENTAIQAFSFDFATSYSTPSGIGGVAGVMSESEISNVEVSGEIYSNYDISEASRTGGIVGFISPFDTTIGLDENIATVENKSKIDNVTVVANIYTRYYLPSAKENKDFYNIAGLIAAVAQNVDITNVVVKDSTITDPNGKIPAAAQEDEAYMALVAGGIAEIYSNTNMDNVTFEGEASAFATKITNVAVENVTIDIAAVSGGFAGFVGSNVNVVDTYVKDLNAKTVINAGFAYSVEAEANVTYTKDFKQTAAVSAKLAGVRNAGFATYNSGNISGFVNETNKTKTYVEVSITGYGADNKQISKIADNVYAAGMVAYMYSYKDGYTANLSNFTVIASMERSTNYAGVVYFLGKDNYTGTYYDTLVENIEVRLSAVSYSNASKNYSTTKKVGGAVVSMFDRATLKNVNVHVEFNKDVDTAKAYSAAIFGGLVAHVQGSVIEISSCGVDGSAYMNEGNYWTRVKTNDGEIVADSPEHFIHISGGLIGLIATDDYNSIDIISEAEVGEGNPYTNISNNEITDFNLVVEGDFDNGVKNTDIFFAVRGIGALIGNVNYDYTDSANRLDLKTNKLSNVTVSANVDAFTFVKVKDSSEELFSLVGAGNDTVGYKAVGMLKEIIDRDSLNHDLAYVLLPERVEGDFTYTNTAPAEDVA